MQNHATEVIAERDKRYVSILLDPLERCAEYLPKMGTSGEVDLQGFVSLYGTDPLYHWMGLDSPLMFAAHKAAGGMTSIYRQLGIGSERLFREVLRDQLGLGEQQVVWSYEVVTEASSEVSGSKARTRTLSLDGRVQLDEVSNHASRDKIADWIGQQCSRLDITAQLKGAVFEVRQGYKSADSKRQNADLSNAAQALGHGFLPVLVIMSTQINEVVHARYTTGNWSVLMGKVGTNDASRSTFDFIDQVLGYDLVSFFERNKEALRAGTERILTRLLEAK